MKGISVGIIGIGNMGSAHLNCIAGGEICGMKVTAVCDIDVLKLKAAKEKYSGISTFTDYRELIKSDVDAVIIAVPHPLHADIAVCALNSGKHTLLEKPADISVTKARILNETARYSNAVFGIMFNQRTNNLFAKARKIVKGGGIGKINRSVWIITNWYRTQHYYDSGDWRATWKGEGGGVLINQAPHNLDIWQWICGMPENVTAFCSVGKYHNIEVEDDAAIYACYKDGATGVFITSTGEYPGTNRLEIDGTAGKIVIENGILKYWKLSEDTEAVSRESADSFVQIDSEYSEFSAQPETAHKGILQNFTNAVISGEELIAPGTDGINELEISNAAYLSEWCGNKKISLPVDGAEFDKILLQKQKNSSFKASETERSDGSYSRRWAVRW